MMPAPKELADDELRLPPLGTGTRGALMLSGILDGAATEAFGVPETGCDTALELFEGACEGFGGFLAGGGAAMMLDDEL
jgi:hypothetical protein